MLAMARRDRVMKDPNKVKAGRAARQKGKNAEKVFKNYLVEDAKSRYGDLLGERDFILPVGAERGVDVKLSTAAHSKYPISPEIKYGAENTTCRIWHDQATNHASKDSDNSSPVVFLRRGRSSYIKEAQTCTECGWQNHTRRSNKESKLYTKCQKKKCGSSNLIMGISSKWHPPDSRWLAVIDCDEYFDMLELWVREKESEV